MRTRTKAVLGLVAAAVIGCGVPAATTAVPTTPPPANPPVGSQAPATQPGLILQPAAESQAIGIAPDN